MSRQWLAELSHPRTRPDRRRWVLVAVSCATTAALALTALRILRYHDPGIRQPLVPYIEQPGLRGGVLLGAVLAGVPPLVLLVQALRVGSAARTGRLVALRLSGASHSQLRRLATVEGAGAGLAGAGVGAIVYLLLAAVTPSLPTRYLRFVPAADAADLVLVPAVVVVLGLLAGLAARLSAHEVIAAPSGPGTALPRPLPRSRAVAGALLAVLIGLLAVAVLSRRLWPDVGVPIVIVLAVACAFVLTPYLGLASARWLRRSPDPMAQLAAARLAADPRTPGRVAAVVLVCAMAITIALVDAASVVGAGRLMLAEDAKFYLVGAGTAAAVALVALVVAGLSLIVAAAEQVVDGRRATAALSAFGVSQADLVRATRRQLGAVTVPAAAVGAVLAALVGVPTLGGLSSSSTQAALAGAVGGIAVALAAGLGAARIATALLSPQLAEAMSAENLRTA